MQKLWRVVAIAVLGLALALSVANGRTISQAPALETVACNPGTCGGGG